MYKETKVGKKTVLTAINKTCENMILPWFFGVKSCHILSNSCYHLLINTFLSFKSSPNPLFFFFYTSVGYLQDCLHMFWIMLVMKLKGLYVPCTVYPLSATDTPLFPHISAAIMPPESTYDFWINSTRSHASFSMLEKRFSRHESSHPKLTEVKGILALTNGHWM